MRTRDPDWRATIEHAVYWNVRSETSLVDPDGGCILLQTTLERLAWQLLVIDGKSLSEDGFSRNLLKYARVRATGVQLYSSNRHAWRRANSRWDVQLCIVGAAGSGGSSVACSSQADGRGVGFFEPRVRCSVRGLRAAVDCAGVYSAGAAVAGVLLGALGATAGRADRLQPAVSLVRGPGHGRCGVEPRGIFQEPRPAADQHRGAELFRRSEPAGEEVHVRRTLYCGRHADPGLGLTEELSCKRRLR